MTRMRAQKVAGIAADIPELEVDDPDGDAKVLVLGWGGTYGPIAAGVRRVARDGRKVAHAHLRYLNPFPRNTGDVVRRYEKVLDPGDEHGPAAAARPRRSSSSTRSATTTSAACRCARPRSPTRSRRWWTRHDRDERQRHALTAKDFRTDQEVRWCPGCGDYAILAAMQAFMPELGIARENTVFVSGIGCAARFPYYMNTYGLHSIHGRAPAIATGLATSRPDLSVWVVTGDGDALSIGGNHLIHSLRRNVNFKILLFNNKIYGLTKGQYSPTSELGEVTKSTPMGSIDWPFNPLSLAIGAEATFVGRAIDTDKKGMTDGAARGGRASRQRVRRDPPELPDLQRRRVGVRARRQGGREPHRAAPRRADHVGQGRREGAAPAPGRDDRGVRGERRGVLVHDATHTEPSLAFALSRVTQGDARRHAGRRLPQRVAPGLRRPDGGTAGDGGAKRGEGISRSYCTPARPGSSARSALRAATRERPFDPVSLAQYNTNSLITEKSE